MKKKTSIIKLNNNKIIITDKHSYNRLHNNGLTLDKELALSLCKELERGAVLYRDNGGRFKFLYKGQHKEIPYATINNWIYRSKTIIDLEKGLTFREMVENSRKILKENERIRRQELMIDEAEVEMHKTLRISTVKPIVSMKGEIVDYGHDAKLLAVKMDTAKYIKDRLDPKYKPKQETKNTHLVFSLAELRKIKENDINNEK